MIAQKSHETCQARKERGAKELDVAYAIQNAGNPLSQDVGQAILIKHTVRGLQRAGHRVTVVRLRERAVMAIGDVDAPEAAIALPLGVSGTRPFMAAESGVRRLQTMLRLPYFAAFDTFRFYEACRRALGGFAVCHEYGGLLSSGAALACWRSNVPYVLTVDADPFVENRLRGTPLTGIRGLVARQEARLTHRLAQKIVTVSSATKTHLIDEWDVPESKIAVLPNGVDTELFKPGYDVSLARAELGLRDEPTVGFVGGFQQWHGLEGLIESFAHVIKALPDAKLLLVGDGEARPAVEEKIAERGLTGSVIITGLIAQARVPVLLAAMDVAVAPYPNLPQEMWFSPLKLYEYMAAGKAVVASAAGQIVEAVVDGESGILVPPGDVTALADAIVALLQDPERRHCLGQNARQQAVAHHSWDHYIGRLEAIYESVV